MNMISSSAISSPAMPAANAPAAPAAPAPAAAPAPRFAQWMGLAVQAGESASADPAERDSDADAVTVMEIRVADLSLAGMPAAGMPAAQGGADMPSMSMPMPMSLPMPMPMSMPLPMPIMPTPSPALAAVMPGAAHSGGDARAVSGTVDAAPRGAAMALPSVDARGDVAPVAPAAIPAAGAPALPVASAAAAPAGQPGVRSAATPPAAPAAAAPAGQPGVHSAATPPAAPAAAAPAGQSGARSAATPPAAPAAAAPAGQPGVHSAATPPAAPAAAAPAGQSGARSAATPPAAPAAPVAAAADAAVPVAAEAAPAPAGVWGMGTPAAGQGGADSIKLAGPAQQWQQPLREALGERLQVQIGNNTEQALIRLEPPMLGRIEILIRHNAGALQVMLSASNGDVLRQLHTISDSLQRDLAQRQFTDVAVTVAPTARLSAGAGAPFGEPQQRPRHGGSEQPEADPGRALQEAGHPSARFSMNQP